MVTITPTFSAANLTSKPLQVAAVSGETLPDSVNFIPQDLTPSDEHYEPLLFWNSCSGPEGGDIYHHLALSAGHGSPWSKTYSLTDLSLDMDNLELPSAKYF